MPSLICPNTKELLSIKGGFLVSRQGIKYPIINNIPRFVHKNNYAKSFGLQWNKFRKAQLDSYTNTTLSTDRLKRICGGDLTVFNNKSVLEVGCGAGRFTEIMLKNNADVYAVDLSNAVEANYSNFSTSSNYHVFQANVYQLPFEENSFDFVVCIGVIQHTPDSEKTIESLIKYIKPGGILLIDHYDKNYPYTRIRKIWRKILLFFPLKLRFAVSKYLVIFGWPLHKLFWNISLNWKKSNRGERLRKVFLRLSPIVDYHDVYTELNKKQLREWAILDTHDTLTDYYKHLRSKEEIEQILTKANMSESKVWIGGNGVEARAIK